ncbi:MAG: helix-turn-helix domain-containing protein [Oscillospiraceae bacterium]|nr:helix-turn-helix domain-containing protein [Oscillospiraceae bacterium]
MEKKDVQINFGNNLKKYRVLSGKSQEELAFEADLSTVYLGIIERGERCPTIDTLLKICSVLKISPLCLLDFGDEPDDTEPYSIIKYALKDVPDIHKMKLACFFEKFADLYKENFKV